MFRITYLPIMALTAGLSLALVGCKNTPVVDAPASSGTVTRPVDSATAPASVADRLTMFRGNPERNLSGVGTVPRVPKLLWRFRTKDKAEGPYEQRGDVKLTAASTWKGCGWTGQPIMQEGKVYFGSADSYVYCLQAMTGAPVWYYPNHHVIKGSISIFGDSIYHGGRDNKIHCYSLDGKMRWETRTGNDMDSNPVVVDGKGYIGAEDFHIYSFAADTGKILWKSEKTIGSIESSPTIVGNKVIAGGNGTLYCLNIADGKTIWKASTLGDTDSTTVHWQGKLYVGSKTAKVGETGHLWCLDAETGKTIWHETSPRGYWATPALDPAKGMLYIGTNDGNFAARNMSDGKVVWQRKLGNRIWSSAAVVDGCVVVGVRNGQLWCLRQDTGEPMWVFDEGYDIDATPLVCGGMIVIGSQDGWVYGIGESAKDEQLNPAWFTTKFPSTGKFTHNPQGITSSNSPAPPPVTYQDTSAKSDDHLLQPVYGAAYLKK